MRVVVTPAATVAREVLMKERCITVRQLQEHPAVAHAHVWRDRVAIDVRGKPYFKGEQLSRVWLRDDQLIIKRARGRTSAAWESNLASLRAWLVSQGIRLQD